MAESTVDLYLAEPRGFCGGVRRAIGLVEEALTQFGAPVYVRHEIVHNKHVIADLEKKGAVFIEELSEAQNDRPVIFSAHGVGLDVIEEAQTRGLKTIDATCPLVNKVHQQIKKFNERNMQIVVIGKHNHPEIIGTIGQVKNQSRVHVINSIEEIDLLDIAANEEIGFVTQTTLSADDTRELVAALKRRFPQIGSMAKSDICYATTNRQQAVKALVEKAPMIIVLGSKNSSNSKQLKETALKAGAVDAVLIDSAEELDWQALQKYDAVGISAGASAPEYLVEELLLAISEHYDKININHVIFVKENVTFK